MSIGVCRLTVPANRPELASGSRSSFDEFALLVDLLAWTVKKTQSIHKGHI